MLRCIGVLSVGAFYFSKAGLARESEGQQEESVHLLGTVIRWECGLFFQHTYDVDSSDWIKYDFDEHSPILVGYLR